MLTRALPESTCEGAGCWGDNLTSEGWIFSVLDPPLGRGEGLQVESVVGGLSSKASTRTQRTEFRELAHWWPMETGEGGARGEGLGAPGPFSLPALGISSMGMSLSYTLL